MNNCTYKFTDNLSALNDRKFAAFLDHAEVCKSHSQIRDKYEAEALPFIKLAFPDKPAKFATAASPGIPFHNYKGTSFTSMPRRHKPKGRSIEEEIISENVREAFKTGVTAENYRKCLDMLESNSSIVQSSWTNTLNMARAFAGLGQRKEARRILDHVLTKYERSREAIGSVFEVRSWLDELNYSEGNKADQKYLDRRMENINKGLKFYPENYMLWINAFEFACLKNYTEEAVSYLRRLERIDNKIARQYLFDSPIKKEISRAGNSLKKEVIRVNPKVEME